LARSADFFSFLGLPRKLNVDMADLEQRYRALSRQFHPDYFYNAPPAERRASLEQSSYLNDAYRALRDPVRRIEYLLALEESEAERGEGAPAKRVRGAGAPGQDKDAAKQVPPALLEEVFALNEELDEMRELRGGGVSAEQLNSRLERAREPIEAKRMDHEAQIQQLSAKWDAAVDRGASHDERRAILESLRERFLERNYITNLLAGIERELNS
jgi:molecular chaperone HscB